ncbi:NUDIX domain-containing protein [Bittarella massiliensis (ex Durand et al. 2017)]|uniref:NUDIX domain-containing protein n=1 Tax=Bittarella massiliensis (ex Durand et al. 2017) TaxID=1720313 RepID=A0ABW9WXV2_9FIRM|nr:NUDIX domain-containing protein [Bittarella massiliensis (ex Durand et al. 2017)]
MIRQAVGAIVRDRAGRFLLARKVRVDARQGDGAIPPEWGFVKGGVRPGEGAEEALWRELWEETGSRAFVLEAAFAEPISFSFPPEMAARLGFTGQETRMFLLRYTGRTPLSPADSEIDALEFVEERGVPAADGPPGEPGLLSQKPKKMSQSPLPFKLGWLLPPSFLFCPHPPATANAEALPGKRVASLCRAIPVKSLVPTDSEIDSLEFVEERGAPAADGPPGGPGPLPQKPKKNEPKSPSL